MGWDSSTSYFNQKLTIHLCIFRRHVRHAYRFIQEGQDPEQESFIFAAREEFPSIAACEKSVTDSGLNFHKSSQTTFSFKANLLNLKESFLMQNLGGLWAGASNTITKMLEEAASLHKERELQVSINLGVFCATKA